MKKPKILPKEEMDFKQVISLCKDNLNEISRGDSVDSDTKHYIYEAAMEAVFDKDVWKYVNGKIK